MPSSVNLCFEFVKKWTTTLILQDMFRSIIDHLRHKCVFENYHEQARSHSSPAEYQM